MEAEPDKWDRAAIFAQWKGLNYRANRADAELVSQHERMESLAKLLEVLPEYAAKIGELQARLEEAEKKHETMAKWLREKLAKEKNGVET